MPYADDNDPRKAANERKRALKYLDADPARRERQRIRQAVVNAARTAEKRAWLDAYRETHPCVDCGEADPIVLEFDHVRGVKSDHVARLVHRRDTTAADLAAEVAKCEVRCANCHRRVTHARRSLAEAV